MITLIAVIVFLSIIFAFGLCKTASRDTPRIEDIHE